MLDEIKIKAIASDSIITAYSMKVDPFCTPELHWVYDQFLVLVKAINENGLSFRSNPEFILAFMGMVLDKEKTIINDPYADKRDFIHEIAGKTLQKPHYV